MSEAVEKKALVPKLRFPEFERQPATVVQLCKLAKPVTGGTPSGDPAPVLTLSAEHGIISQDAYFGKRVAGENTDRYTFIERGDFVYNDRITSQSRYGTIRRLYESASGIVSPIYKCFRFSDEADATFFDFYLQSGKHDSEIRSLINEGARSGRYNLTITQFLSTRVPKLSSAEQRRIADCLHSLDELIAAQAEKLEALKRHKKGLLQQLFPAEGETTPRLRFPQFRSDAEWRLTDLGSVANISSDTTPPRSNKEYFLGGTIPWVKTMDLNNSHIRSTHERVTEASGVKVNPAGSVLVAMYGGFNQIGRTGVVTEPAATNQAIAVLTPKPGEVTSAYLLLWLNANVDMWRRVAASSRKDANITSGDVASFSIKVPQSEEEQNAIGEAVGTVTEAISEAYLYVEELRIQKAALMQQLFPSVEEIDNDRGF